MKFQFKKRQALAMLPSALEGDFDEGKPTDTGDCNGIALVSVCGPLEHHESGWWDSYDGIVARLECAFEDDDVKAVVMVIDSPGGDASGCFEAHKEIQRLKGIYNKPLYAYSNESMYSAAYAIGSAADSIHVPETGGVGSVGVICPLVDRMKANEKAGLNVRLLTTGARKADSHDDRPMTSEVIASVQSRVDFLGQAFFKIVAKSRKMSVKEVAGLEAGCFLGQEAVDAGLADGVSGWYDFLNHVESQLESTVGDTQMNMKKKLQAAVASASKKLGAAKSSVERKKLQALYETAVTALVTFDAKTKYSKKTVEEKSEEDEDDAEEEDDEEDASEAEEEEDASEEDASEEDAEEDDEDDEASEEDAKAMSLKSLSRLFAAASKATNQKDFAKIVGALEGMGARKTKLSGTEKRLAKLETQLAGERVDKLLATAISEGRVLPAQKASLREVGVKEGVKWLKGFLSMQPKSLVRTSKDGAIVPKRIPDEELTTETLSPDMRNMVMMAATASGLSFDDQLKAIKELSAANGVKRLAPTH